MRELAEEGKLPKNLKNWRQKGHFVKLEEVGGPIAIGSSWQEFNVLVDISQLRHKKLQIHEYKRLKAFNVANIYLRSALKNFKDASMLGVSYSTMLSNTSHFDLFLDICSRYEIRFTDFKVSNENEETVVTTDFLKRLSSQTTKAVVDPLLKSVKATRRMWDNDRNLLSQMCSNNQMRLRKGAGLDKG